MKDFHSERTVLILGDSPAPGRWQICGRACRCLALGVLGSLAAVGAGCSVTQSGPMLESEIHASDDIAVSRQQARLRLRALVEPLSGAIIEAADRILTETSDRSVRRGALVWKLEAVPAVREALFRPNPAVALMDTWVLMWQMVDYFRTGPGKEALGQTASLAQGACQGLEAEVGAVAASMSISGEVSDARAFARSWAAEHPIRHAISDRESTLSRVTERQLREALSMQEAAGTALVTLDDVVRRMDVYSVQLLDQARWQCELLAMDILARYGLEDAAMVADKGVQAASRAATALERLEPVMQDLGVAAKSAPETIARERGVSLEYMTRERVATVAELRETVAAEREVLLAAAKEAAHDEVDRFLLLVAQIAAAILLLAFLGAVVLLFVARRLFVTRSGAREGQDAAPP